MKRLLLVLAYLIITEKTVHAQLELSTGYAINRVEADGACINIGYSFKLGNRFNTKSQAGYKYLYHYDDFIEATIRFSILELHQTLSYELIKKQNYILAPNIGLNYRIYDVLAEIKPPYNTLPRRGWNIERIRGNRIKLSSFDGEGDKRDKRTIHNMGFSFQLQNQFHLKNNVWLHITPFVEPDYDRTQNVGGCYLGVILKDL